MSTPVQSAPPVVGGAPPPVVAGAPPVTAASTPYGSPAPQPVAQPRLKATEGANILAFTTMTDIMDVTSGLASDPAGAQAFEVDPHVAASLDSKLKQAFDYLVGLHGLPGIGGQAMHFVKTTGTSLLKGATAKRASTPPETWTAHVTFTSAESALYNKCLADVELRDGLEERTLRTCGSCKFQRIINPDYEKMLQRRRVADTILFWQRSILRAIGRSNADPNFVCMRCQGLTYSDRSIALCPQCGTPNMALMLTSCGHCGWDFVNRVKGEPPKKGRSQPKPSPTPAPKKAPGSGKLLMGSCSKCGNKMKVPIDRIPEAGLKGKCSQCGQPVTFRRPKPAAPG